MPKREIVSIFRERLTGLIAGTGESRARFAARAGLDRSTLSQLLSEENVRLPRAETIARIAGVNGASVDWLLGLSDARGSAAGITAQPTVAEGADDPSSAQLALWHAEAKSAKIRYVPSGLPDQLKTEAVITYENARYSMAEAAALAEWARGRIAHMRKAESEIEVCTSRQALEGFARGEGMWGKLSLRDRRRQLEHMADVAEELYPAYRWFLFDGRERFSAPYTVFGQTRAALYLGAEFLVFTSPDHVRLLTRHFDDLIRNARVQPNEVPTLIRRLMKDTP
ncbi:helix-turn-helix domain-containing protein [Aestuariivirga sp.]|uniref:helix-turn-helix domain-containing protein n=1 Tax=Aestuariivirga sp. TaxID=2650926 RepID=UPI0039E2615F